MNDHDYHPDVAKAMMAAARIKFGEFTLSTMQPYVSKFFEAIKTHVEGDGVNIIWNCLHLGKMMLDLEHPPTKPRRPRGHKQTDKG